MSVKEVKVIPGDLTDGLDGIERDLGLPQGQTAFLNEYSIPGKRFPDASEPKDWVLGDTWAPLYPMPLVSSKSLLMTSGVPQSLTEYLEYIGLIPSNPNILESGLIDDLEDRYYPKGSVIGQLIDKGSNIFDLQGKTIIPSFVTDDVLRLAEMHGGSTLVTPEASISFNAKALLRELAAEAGFQVAPGVIIRPGDDINDAVIAFNEMAQGLSVTRPKCWLKFSPAAGGGTFALDEASPERIKKWVTEFLTDASQGYQPQILNDAVRTYDDLPADVLRDLVLEVDTGSLPNTKILGNYGFQAIIGADKITYVGATKQLTEDGDYLGGETLSDDDRKIETELLPQIIPVFQAYWEKGYRGFMGVDALALRQNSELKASVLEANCRMTAATPLLAVVQKLEAARQQPLCGRLVTFKLPLGNQTGDAAMSEIFSALGQDLHEPWQVSGVIPFMADIFPKRGDMSQTKVRCIVIGRHMDEVSFIHKSTEARLSIKL